MGFNRETTWCSGYDTGQMPTDPPVSSISFIHLITLSIYAYYVSESIMSLLFL